MFRYRVVYPSDSRGSEDRAAVELSTSPENAGYGLRRTRRHGGGMCENCDIEPARELIQGLLLEAGRLMEDESPELAMILPREPALIAARVDRLHRVATDMLALAVAAQALARSIGDEIKRA